jgi:haloalkane dehalogenase
VAADVFRTPDERFADLDGYGFEPNYVELTGDLSGLRMHYVDEGPVDEGSLGEVRSDPILLLHGEPSWAYLYRTMIPALEGTGRVLAPDHIGFGRSDKVTSASWYSYDKHVDALWAFIEALDLKRITLVVQDWGGPIGLRVATEHPERFARLVILNTYVFHKPAPDPSPAFVAWQDFARQNPDLPIGFIIQSATTTELSEAVLAGYEAPFPTAESKAGAASFPLLVPLTDEDAGADSMHATAMALLELEIPTLVAFSDSDPMFSTRLGRRWADSLVDGRFVEIEGAGHFLQEDRGEAIATEISKFIESTPSQ